MNPTPPKPLAVLIVDDSAVTRAVIRRAVKLCGVAVDECYEACNGRAALDAMASRRVDLVLADLNMPEMDGFEMIRRIAADPHLAGTPVVVISSEPNAAAFAAGRPGVRGCLAKPFTPEGVRDVLLAATGVPRG